MLVGHAAQGFSYLTLLDEKCKSNPRSREKIRQAAQVLARCGAGVPGRGVLIILTRQAWSFIHVQNEQVCPEHSRQQNGTCLRRPRSGPQIGRQKNVLETDPGNGSYDGSQSSGTHAGPPVTPSTLTLGEISECDCGHSANKSHEEFLRVVTSPQPVLVIANTLSFILTRPLILVS